MRRLLVTRNFGLLRSIWNSGSEGEEWKARHLDERRKLALMSLSDPTKRLRIHDAIRAKAVSSRRRLQDLGSPTNSELPPVLNDHNTNGDIMRAEQSDDELIEELFAALVDESLADSLANIPDEELRLLQSELYSCNNGNTEVSTEWLRSWLKLRKDSDLFESYSTLPSEERNPWSAWYLRDIRAH